MLSEHALSPSGCSDGIGHSCGSARHALCVCGVCVCVCVQGTELDCDLGNGQLYRAQWLVGPAVNCSGVTVSSHLIDRQSCSSLIHS